MTEQIKGVSPTHYETSVNLNKADDGRVEEQTFKYEQSDDDKMKGLQIEKEEYESIAKANSEEDGPNIITEALGKVFVGAMRATTTVGIVLPMSSIFMTGHFIKGVFTGNIGKEVKAGLDTYEKMMDATWKDN